MIENAVISQQANHGHLSSNPFFLSVILGKNWVQQKLEKLLKGLVC